MAKVIILGGGVAGMSTAHELVERSFEVEVFEPHHTYAGGKARSVNVPGTNLLHRDKYLPGEHGFRFFPGCYKHVIDTRKRIPFRDRAGNENPEGVFNNLVPVNRKEIAPYGKKPIVTKANFPKSLEDICQAINCLHADTGLTSEEKSFFARKISQLMTSCTDLRRAESKM